MGRWAGGSAGACARACAGPGAGGRGSYAQDCNDRLFLNYGFTVPGNPSPCRWDAPRAPAADLA
jgi:hypothetical protein